MTRNEFQRFIEEYSEDGERVYEAKLSEISLDKTKPFVIDFSHLFSFDPDLAESLERDSRSIVGAFTDVVKSKLRMRGTMGYTGGIRFFNFVNTTPLRSIHYNHIGKLLQIEGIVVKANLTEQRMTKTTFSCLACRESIVLDQISQFTIYPKSSECPTKGCAAPGFDIDEEHTSFIKQQKISIQELPDKVPSGRLPRTFKLVLTESLADVAKPGERIEAIGIIRAIQNKKHDQNPAMSLMMVVNHIEKNEDINQDITLTEGDVAELTRKAKSLDHLKNVAESIAPRLHGLSTEKQALALQQCEGNTLVIQGEHVRGQFHILLAGDPGQGKSQLMDFMSTIHPRGIKVTGKGATAAGLTAAVVKDEETGDWTLMAGAMVLADKGLVCADEFEKMRNEDRSAMHPAMAQQKIPINKAGINVELNTRCSVLAACNPKLGQWNDRATLTGNIKLPIPLISRFDLIFVMKNDRTISEEMARVDHVLDIRSNPEGIEPPFSHEELRKLFAYARTLKPKLTEPVMAELRKFYEEMAKAAMVANDIMITLRQLEGLIRLTEASAKLHLREETTIRDARNAIRILNESLIQSGVDPATGNVDIGMITTGIPKSVREKLRRLVDVVRELTKASIGGDFVTGEVLTDWLEQHWLIDKTEIAKLLEIAREEGVIICPKIGCWRAT
jgi:replicative DNA helicase Mcm